MSAKDVFKSFFRLIFSIVAVVFGVIAFGFLFAPFITSSYADGNYSSTLTISGFDLAFTGDCRVDDGNVSTFSISNYSSIGAQVSVYLLMAGVIFSIIYLIFCWGRSGAKIKKAIGTLSAVTFLVSGVLSFCSVPMAGIIGIHNFSEFSTGYGAIVSGIASILAAVAVGMATFLGKERPETKKQGS